MIPKAKLLLIGGAENKGDAPPDVSEQKKEFRRYEILSELLPPSNKKIEIITTGSEIQNEVKKIMSKSFRIWGMAILIFSLLKKELKRGGKNT